MSRASSDGESWMDRFRHTGQRSVDATSLTFRSRVVSEAPGGPCPRSAPAKARRQNSTAAPGGRRLISAFRGRCGVSGEELRDPGVQNLGCDWSGQVVENVAVTGDEKGFRH